MVQIYVPSSAMGSAIARCVFNEELRKSSFTGLSRNYGHGGLY